MDLTKHVRKIEVKKEPKVFYIQDIANRKGRIDIYKNRVVFHRIRQHIVILNIFSKDCFPCRGMLPYLNDLQRKNKKSVFVIGIPIDVRLRANH